MVSRAIVGALLVGILLAQEAEVSIPFSQHATLLALTPDGRRLVTVNPDSNSISMVDLPTHRVVAEISLGRDPQTVALDAEGRRAYVTNRADDTLSAVDLEARQVVRTIPTGDEPFAALVSDDGRIFVSNAGSGSLSVYRVASLEPLATVETSPHPRGLALSADGARLYVTHFGSGELTVVDTETLRIEAVISTGPDSNLSQGIALDPLSKRAYLPQTRSNATNRALLFDTTVFPVVSAVDLDTRENLRRERIALDLVDEPVGIPLDAVIVPETRALYVVNAASNDVSVIDLDSGKGIAHVEVGDNPRGIVLAPDGRRAYVNNTLSGTVSVIDTRAHTVTGTFSVTQIPLPEDVWAGKILFNSSDDPRLARDQWVSCATCHFDGGADGRTWLFRDGPRNTPSLLGVAGTGPFHWSGDLDELYDVESTIRNVQAGTGLIEGPDGCDPACDQGPSNAGRSESLDQLVAYLNTLRLPPNPNLDADGMLTAAAERGKALFFSESTGCASCHGKPHYTDRQQHDVGTGVSPLERKGTAFDTPSLAGIHATAPYLHDGRAETLLDVLTAGNSGDRHGIPSHLTEDELADLVAFLKSLPY